MTAASQSWKRQGTDSPLGPPEGTILADTCLSPVRLCLDFGLQHHERINFCCINIKPPSLRSDITAALGNKDGTAIKIIVV